MLWDTLGAFQTGYINLRRALRSENNHCPHTEGSFQTKVLKTGHFKGPLGLKDFEGYNWWTLRAPMILCADSLHDARGTHNSIIHYLFNTHTYLHFKFAHVIPVHNCLYYIFCFCIFIHCLFCIFLYYKFYYLCPGLSLSFCGTVETSVTKTNSLYV